MKPVYTGKRNDSPKFAERFIPNRNSSNLTSITKFNTDIEWVRDEPAYSCMLKGHFFGNSQTERPLFQYTATPGKENQECTSFVDTELYSPLKVQRKIPTSPFKVLDAPALQDDFYLNLLDWSSLNILTVGLVSSVYLWNASNSKVSKLCDLGTHTTVSSVAWTESGCHLAVGTSQGTALLWDAHKNKLVRSFHGHTARIGAMAWNNSLLCTASRDRHIFIRDARAPGDCTSRLNGHRQEVCGLKWSPDGQQLSSGGNDNRLLIWSLHSTNPVVKVQKHTAAIKALAWSPHQHGLLASGGGTADRTIRLTNALTGEQLACIDTGSQVCNLMYSVNSDELVSTHGYSMNQIFLWNGTKKLGTLTGHTYRVLYLAMSPDGQTIVTGAGDETLRFWNLFSHTKQSVQDSSVPLMPSFMNIR